ncbi:FG-GAP-like repeat-containing protein [Mucilaginibacter kameinonensis]|uniref:FG-GAP-like repeat-containing protein n=1 Tax=Mucilaginibacter kameinonensis TaxID=452286 RepID=UPI000EF8265B|nr:FG-GAP-like repeat-containing protein [Mucilaginibacter kameinonensis]
MKKTLLFYNILLLFTVNAFAQSPYVSTVSPGTGPVGTTVTLSGNYFNTNPTNNIVFFGGVKASVINATATSLTVKVPVGATYKPISVLNKGNGLTGYSTAPFLVTSDSKSALGAADIDPKVDLQTGYLPKNICLSDIDGDGKLDMAVLNTSDINYSVSIYRSVAVKGTIISSSFAGKVDIPTGTAPVGLALQDMDGDGKPDLIVANKADNNVTVYRNNSVSGTINSASFSQKVNFATGTAPLSMAIGDIDGDGRPDIVTANGGVISILRNVTAQGSITSNSFAAKFDIAVALNNVILADFDIDGKLDIAGLNYSGAISILRNQQQMAGVLDKNTFAGSVDFPSGWGTGAIAAVDLNNDYKPELVTVDTYDNGISILTNATNGSGINSTAFLPKISFKTGKQPAAVAFDDLDGDGRLDIVVPEYGDNGISILKSSIANGNITATSFTDKLDVPIAQFTGNVALGDIDGDGRPDIVATNDINKVSILRNNPTNPPIITSISPLSGPVGAEVTIVGANFNKNAVANNVVYFGGVKAIIKSATDKQIIVTVPAGATYKPITVLNKETVRSATSSLAFDITYAGNPGIKAVDFEMAPVTYGGNRYMNVDLADLDGDGALDLVSASFQGKILSIARSKGLLQGHTSDQYNNAQEFDMGSIVDKFQIGDLDGDGKPDIIVVCSAIQKAYVLRNISTIGNIAFEPAITLALDQYYYYQASVMLADIDGDGKLDIVSDTFLGSGLNFYRNTSTAEHLSFTNTNVYFDVYGGRDLHFGDIDGDGKPDLVYTNSSDLSYLSGLFIARNISANGKTAFSAGVKVSDFYTGLIKLADFNGDNKLDIVMSGQWVFQNLSVKGVIDDKSIASPRFLNTGPYSDAYSPFNIADIDGDGKPDVVVSNPLNNNHTIIAIYRNKSTIADIAFDPSIDVDIAAEPGNLVIADINGDGFPDILPALSSGIQPVYYNPQVPVSPPKITSISPLKGQAGTQVTITGSGFNTQSSGNTVVIGRISQVVTTASATSLTVPLPVSSVYDKITVTNNYNNRVSNSWEPFVTTFNSKNSISATDFSDPAYIHTNSRDDNIILADIDGDSKLDIVSLIDSNFYHGAMSVYRNIAVKGKALSVASFASKVDFYPPDVIAVTDIDGDGKPDILSRGGGSYPYGYSFGIYPNTSTPGNLSFGPGVFNGTGGYTLAAAAADIDGDGLVDVISVGGHDDSAVKISANISRKQQPFKFNTEISYKINSPSVSLVVSDLDGDGKPDIITGNDNGSISVLRNKAIASQINTTSFDTEINIGIGKTLPVIPVVGDIDGDGKPDIVAVSTVDFTFCVLRNTSIAGKISFAPKVEFHTTQLFRLMLTDLDGDGKLDIVTSQMSDFTKPTGLGIFRNVSTAGSFTDSSLLPEVEIITGAISHIAAGDLDGDSKPDLVINSPFGGLALFQNNPHVAGKPVISAFGPVQAAKGTMVTIKGIDFTGTTGVNFGGTAATSFTVASPGVITAMVGDGGSGAVSVTTPLGTGQLAGFTYGPPKGTGAVITPLADVVNLTLDNKGTKNITLADIATVTSASANATITLSPSSFSCATAGSQIVAVKVDDAGAAFNPGAVKFDRPTSIAFDATGNMYVTDYNNYRLRKISTNGVVSTIAGNGNNQNKDGNGIAAGISYPSAVVTDPFNNLYVGGNGIRKIDARLNVSPMAGGRAPSGDTYPGSGQGSVFGVSGMAISPDGTLYVADAGGGTIVKVTQTGVATLFAGVYGSGKQDGPGRLASFSLPKDVTVAADGMLYVADANNASIRKITPDAVVSTLTLKGADSYIYPTAIAAGPANSLYILNGNSVAQIAADGTVKIIAGSKEAAGAYIDGAGNVARFNNPTDIALDSKGNIYVADGNNNCIRKIDATGKVSTFAGGVKGYLDGSIGSAPSSVTAQVKVKVVGALVINTTFADKLLPLGADGKATLPDYTNNVSVSGTCGVAQVKITQLPVAGTKINATDKVTVTITAADDAGANISKSFTVTADVNKAIVFNAIGEVVYGAADFAPDVVPPTASTITLSSSNPSVAIINNNKIHITGAGTAVITATASGSYPGQATKQLVVKTAPLSIAADNKTRYVGQSNPVFTFTYAGFVNGDTEASIAVKPVATTSATASSAAGTYPITLSGAVAANYNITYLPGTLTISNNLPTDNFTIAVTGATCKGSKNGSINITAAQSLNYIATLTGNTNFNLQFTNNGVINDLSAGTYNLCIAIAGQSGYSQCYTLIVTEPKDLSLYTVVSPDKKTVQLSMSGATEYHIRLNGALYTTTDSLINLPLMTGKNNLSINSNTYCQGVIEKVINIAESILIYPNAFENSLYINLTNQNPSSVQAEIYSAMGMQVYNGKFKGPLNPLKLDVSRITMAGIYTLKLTVDNNQYTFKIMKK